MKSNLYLNIADEEIKKESPLNEEYNKYSNIIKNKVINT